MRELFPIADNYRQYGSRRHREVLKRTSTDRVEASQDAHAKRIVHCELRVGGILG